MADYTTVSPGDPLVIKADQFNGWQAAAAANAPRQTQTAPAGQGGGLSLVTILVQNTSTSPIARGCVVALHDPVIKPSDQTILPVISFKCDANTGGIKNLAILAEPAPAATSGGGVLVRAYVAGPMVPCRVAMRSVDYVHAPYARINVTGGVDNGSMDSSGPTNGTVLEADFSGGEYDLLWADTVAGNTSSGASGSSGDGNDVRWCFIRHRPIVSALLPTARYQVLTCLDDSFTPIWAQPRFG